MTSLIVSTAVMLLFFFAAGCIFINPVNNFVAWVVGDVDDAGKAMLLFSGDNGETWTRQGLDILPDGIQLVDVFAIDREHVWAVGSQGLVLRTSNGGTNWEKTEVTGAGAGGNFLCISICKNKIWISGEAGLIISSDDNGQSWTGFDLPDNVKEYIIQGIFAINDDIIYAVGNKAVPPNAGLVLRTLDGGGTWEEIELNNNYNENGWIGVKATDTDHVVIYGGRGHYAVTANAGKQWVTGGPLSSRDINSLVMLDHSNYWAACDYDSIIRTGDSGISWEDQESAGASNSFLVGISALNRDNALIVGQSAGYPFFGKILKTSNGGEKWKAVYACDFNLVKVTIAKKFK
jgi:photosystem II stability/assembly factor-like uncharacterized protein